MTTTLHSVSLRFDLDPATARAIAGALGPEAAQAALDESPQPESESSAPRRRTGSDVPKTRGDVHADGDALRIEIHAEDLPSLRAAVNSHLRWVDAAARAARVAR
jgi:hypothetical protein